MIGPGIGEMHEMSTMYCPACKLSSRRFYQKGWWIPIVGPNSQFFSRNRFPQAQTRCPDQTGSPPQHVSMRTYMHAPCAAISPHAHVCRIVRRTVGPTVRRIRELKSESHAPNRAPKRAPKRGAEMFLGGSEVWSRNRFWGRIHTSTPHSAPQKVSAHNFGSTFFSCRTFSKNKKCMPCS